MPPPAVSVAPTDAVNSTTAAFVFTQLPAGEDLDAFHIRDDGTVLFSTTTSVTLEGVTYLAGDIVSYDGVNYGLVLNSGLFGTAENVDAVSELPNGHLLISTATAATLFGFAFADGDVVEVDVAGGTANLYKGLNESALFTGANQNIDALHYDRSNRHLLLSVVSDGPGTIGGYTVTGTGASADLIDLDLSAGRIGEPLPRRWGLYDGATRQLDAAYLFPACNDGFDNDGNGASTTRRTSAATPPRGRLNPRSAPTGSTTTLERMRSSTSTVGSRCWATSRPLRIRTVRDMPSCATSTSRRLVASAPRSRRS